MRKYQKYKPSGVEWIGDIPENWKVIRVKHLVDKSKYYQIGDGDHGSIKPEMYIDKGIPYIRVQNLNWNGEIDLNGLVYISKEVHNKNLKSRIVEGDILIAKTGATIGKLGFVKSNVGESNTTSSVGKVSIDKKKYIPEFYLYNFQTNYFQKTIWIVGSQKSAQPGFNIDDLVDFEVIYPPLQEQKQIVNYLDDKTSIIDKLISTKERKIELLKEQRTSLINQVITKGLNPNVKMKDSGVEWIGEIPENWSFVRLGVLGSFSKGKGITKDKIKEYGFPCIRNGEIYTTYNLRFSEPKSFIDETTISESIKVKKGTLFFTGDGETLEEIGKCVVYLGEDEIYVGGGINVFTPKTDKVSPIYLSYVMSSTSCVYQKSIGGKGEIVVHIYSKQLRDIQFGLPKLQEQQEIVEYLDKHTKEIDDLVSMEQKKIELLKEYRQSLISEVITGKIKVVE